MVTKTGIRHLLAEVSIEAYHIILYPFMLVFWTVRAIARVIVRILMAIIRCVVATPMAIVRVPVRAYRRATVWRNWILAKVEYLQGESQKWKTTFNILKSPYSLLRACGLNPQAAVGILVAGSTVGGGVIVNEITAEKSFSRGHPGIYTAPLDIPIFAPDDFNTLRLDLGSTPVGNIEIRDITVGTAYANSALPTGETSVVILGGLPAVVDPAFTETFLEVGHLVIDRWRCTTMALTNIEAHTLNVKQNASDGQSIAAVAGVPRARAIGGGNRADDMKTSGGYYDQVKITAASSGVNGKVDKLTLSNLYTKGGACTLDRIKAGVIDIVLNEVGAGDGFATKDFSIATSVIYKTFNNEDNVEVSISPP